MAALLTNLITNHLPGFRLFRGETLNTISTNGNATATAVNKLTANGVGRGSGSQTLSLVVTATANTDYTMSLPVGGAVLSMTVYTTTAYGAATDALITIGNVAGGNQYVASTSIKAAAVYPLTIASTSTASTAMLNLPAAPQLFVRVTQTGTASATGAAQLVVTYVVPA